MNLRKTLRRAAWLAAMLLTQSTHAADLVWTNMAGGNWNTATEMEATSIQPSAQVLNLTNTQARTNL